MRKPIAVIVLVAAAWPVSSLRGGPTSQPAGSDREQALLKLVIELRAQNKDLTEQLWVAEQSRDVADRRRDEVERKLQELQLAQSRVLPPTAVTPPAAAPPNSFEYRINGHRVFNVPIASR